MKNKELRLFHSLYSILGAEISVQSIYSHCKKVSLSDSRT